MGLRALHTPAYSSFGGKHGSRVPEMTKTNAYAEKLPVGLIDKLVHEVEERGAVLDK